MPDAIKDDEIVLRHIPGGTTFQAPGPRITSKNFELRPGETGVSVSRVGSTTPDQLMARNGNPATGSRIASATAASVRAIGLEIVSVPTDDDPGHAEIRDGAASLTRHSVRKQLTTIFTLLP